MARCLLVGSFLVGSFAAPEARAQSESPEATERHFVVETSATIAEGLSQGSFQRWVIPNRPELSLEVRTADAAEPKGSNQQPVTVRVLAFPCEQLPGQLDPDNASRLSALPVQLEKAKITLGDTVYDDRRLTVALRLPSPEPDTEGPATWLACGQDAETTTAIADRTLMQLANVRWYGRPQRRELDYLVREHAWMERHGRWQPQEDGGFAIDPDETDGFAARAADRAGRSSVDAAPIRLRVDTQRAEASGWPILARELASAAQAMAPRLGLDATLETIEIQVEPDFAQQGRYLGAIGPAVLTDDHGIHLVLAEDGLSDARRATDQFYWHHALARLLLRRAGHTLPPNLEDGAALLLSDTWYGRTVDAWTADLVAADIGPTAAEVLADAFADDGSRVLWPPLVAAAIELIPGSSLGEKLHNAADPSALGQALEALARRPAPPEPSAASPRPPRPELPSFHNGISFAMANGLDIGYHAPGVDAQLARLRDLGTNAVSLMPFAYQRNPQAPGLAFLNQSPSSETDVGVIHAARRAHAQGLTVLWKPHIWVSFESWPGDIVMRSAEDWSRWFRGYRRYILHHAVLAQHSQAELFSIGVELGQTLGQEAEWRRLIQAVRQVYDGHVTYSGNWWADYDRAPFWDALDAIGVDAYFPLADSAEADRATLVAGARRAAEELAAFSARHGKPVLFTEVGFSAQQGAWVSPHEEGGELSQAHQALAYEVLFETLGHPSWLAGVYVWKAFSHADAEGQNHPDFRFLERPAEPAIARYFQRPQPTVTLSTPR